VSLLFIDEYEVRLSAALARAFSFSEKPMVIEKQTARPLRGRAGKLIVGLAGCLLFLSACEKDQDINAFVDPTVPPDQTYNEALANIDAGDYTQAKRKFKRLDRQHPYSAYAKRAGVMSTYIAYKQGDYAEAAAQGKRFVQLYPANKEAPYALYLVGMSYHRQISDVTRDQRYTKQAYRTMNDLVERYPDSEYVEDAKLKMRMAKD